MLTFGHIFDKDLKSEQKKFININFKIAKQEAYTTISAITPKFYFSYFNDDTYYFELQLWPVW